MPSIKKNNQKQRIKKSLITITQESPEKNKETSK
jgi:hypothetical protein